MDENQDKIALITGASRGLGMSLASALAQKGWTLVIDARGKDALEKVRKDLSIRTRVKAISGDISSEKHRKSLFDTVKDLGRLNLLVNNASFLGPSPQPVLAEYPLSILEVVYKTNVFSPLRLTQMMLPFLAKSEGRIINITSDAAIENYEGWGGYGSSKAALDQITHILAAERPELRIYSVDPGDMNTQMQQEAFPGEDISDRPPPETSVPGLLELIEGELPSGRYSARKIVPEEVRT